VTASRVEKLILDSYSEHPLLLPFFDRTPWSRDIDCKRLAKICEILAGANFFVDANILGLFGMAGWYNQAGTVREEVCPYKSAGMM
jgi:hypothetical protein